MRSKSTTLIVQSLNIASDCVNTNLIFVWIVYELSYTIMYSAQVTLELHLKIILVCYYNYTMIIIVTMTA
jgi:hypothetical protein